MKALNVEGERTIIEPLRERILGRVVAADVVHRESSSDTSITRARAAWARTRLSRSRSLGIDEVKIRVRR
jgi:DNA-directed RNA polymerase subunit beta'